MAVLCATAMGVRAQISISGANAVVTPTGDVYYSVINVPATATSYHWTALGDGVTLFDFLTPVLRARFQGAGQNRIVVAVGLADGAVLRDTLVVYKNTCAAVVGAIAGPTGICRDVSAALSVHALIGENRTWEVAPSENGPWREARFGIYNADKSAYQTPGLQADSVYRIRVSTGACAAQSGPFRVIAYPEPMGGFAAAPAPVCVGKPTLPLQAQTITGIGRWETTGQGSFVNPFDPNTRYQSVAADAGRRIILRWVVENGPCTPKAYVQELDVLPGATAAILEAPQSVCATGVSGTFRATATGGVGQWICQDCMGTIVNAGQNAIRYRPVPEESGMNRQFTWVVVNTVCQETLRQSVNLRIVPSPKVRIVRPAADTAVCSGDPVEFLAVAPGFTGFYEWLGSEFILYPNTPRPVAYPRIGSRFIVKFSLPTGDGFVCESYDTVLVSIETRRPDFVGTGGDICPGDSIPLVVTGEDATFVWSPETGLSNPFVRTPMASPAVSTTYTFVARAPGKCETAGVVRVNVLTPPNPNLKAENTCQFVPDHYLTMRNPDECVVKNWFSTSSDNLSATIKARLKAGETLSSQDHPNWISSDDSAYVDTSVTAVRGDYVYCFSCYDQRGCHSLRDVNFSILRLPAADFKVDDGRTDRAFTDREIQFVYTGDTAVNNYFWTFGDEESGTFNISTQRDPVHLFSRSGKFTIALTVSNSACANPVIKVDYITIRGEEFYFPTAFSPNGDGLNERFRPLPIDWQKGDESRLAQTKLVTLQIFDRFNQKVFETDDPNGWDGRTDKGKELDPGVYSYKAVIDQDPGGLITYTGYVTLVR
jgi:gliding motility-associated-like protein